MLGQSVVATAQEEVAWPDLCARVDQATSRTADEVRRYQVRLNDQATGSEIFWFWRDGGHVRVVVKTAVEGSVLVFPADFKHCRHEWWREESGRLQLIEVESETRYAVPFKPDYQIHLVRDPERGEVVYRGKSVFGVREQRFPEDTSAVTPWSVRTIDYTRLLDLFGYGSYRIQSKLIGRGMVDGHEVVHYAMGGEWPRHLWYDDGGKMVRFCAKEALGTIVETIYEPYVDLDTTEAGLDQSCAEQFQ